MTQFLGRRDAHIRKQYRGMPTGGRWAGGAKCSVHPRDWGQKSRGLIKRTSGVWGLAVIGEPRAEGCLREGQRKWERLGNHAAPPHAAAPCATDMTVRLRPEIHDMEDQR